jgi:hypothetical protein
LHILYSAWAKIADRNVDEEPKIAFYKGRSLATVRGMIHWIPLAAAAVLISFNIMQYYIGGELAGSVGQVCLFQIMYIYVFATSEHHFLTNEISGYIEISRAAVRCKAT